MQTPGPWEIDRNEAHGDVLILTAAEKIAVASLWTENVESLDAVMDDARLIAAAPEMLALLKTFVAAFGADHIKGHGGTDCFHCDARALLARIGG